MTAQQVAHVVWEAMRLVGEGAGVPGVTWEGLEPDHRIALGHWINLQAGKATPLEPALLHRELADLPDAPVFDMDRDAPLPILPAWRRTQFAVAAAIIGACN